MKRKHLVAMGAVAFAAFTSLALAHPGPTACLLAGASAQHRLSNGMFADAASRETEQQHLAHLMHEARKRIETTFGKAESNPIVVFLGGENRFGPFKLNSFGSTHFIGSRACVMIGSKGESVDVVAHELMHAELHQRVGVLRYFLEIPTWFDEGVAMQVDYRSRYSLSAREAENSRAVRALTTASRFFVSDDEALTRNYAFAKHEVSIWMSQVGGTSLYSYLGRVNSGVSFEQMLAR